MAKEKRELVHRPILHWWILVANRTLGFLKFREKERGEVFYFKGLQKPLSAQIQEN
jgi:hypothetical protein